MGELILYIERDGFYKIEFGLPFEASRNPWPENCFKLEQKVDDSIWRIENLEECNGYFPVRCYKRDGKSDERGYHERVLERITASARETACVKEHF